jgi:spore coat protein A, manganese oxidase
MKTRRTFLKTSVTATAGVLAFPFVPQLRAAKPARLLVPRRLRKFIDPLPRPGVLAPAGNVGGAPFYEVSMTGFMQELHSELPPTYLWGYNGSFPGPTIEARSGEPIYVRWINQLPTHHFLPVDFTLHGANMGEPEVRAAVHLHGGHVPPETDGGPEDWFMPGHAKTLWYPNAQHAAPLWYHDHALGITRLNVYAGLAGLYFVRDGVEDRLNLPGGEYEVPLVIQDRMFNSDGSLFYPISDLPISPQHPGPWVPEFFGNTILVNGKVWPYLAVEPRRYRFRIYNGSNARFYRLAFSSGQPFTLIGAEGGLFQRPIEVTQILLAPAERADVIVDFNTWRGRTLLLTNDANAPFPDGDPVDGGTAPIMQFRVTRPLSRPDTSEVPTFLRTVPRIPARSAAVVRDISIREFKDEDEDPILAQLGDRDYDDPVLETPVLGTAEIWRFINTTGDTHPIHVHLIQFQVLDRQPFDVDTYLNTEPRQIVFTGPAVPPEATEAGWKDTVRANPGEATRIIARFEDFSGRYVYHCHILEHEDNEMMRPFDVIRP